MQTTPSSRAALTFVVRLWRETDAGGHRNWRGRVEHVGTPEVRYAESVADITDCIERWVNPIDSCGPAATPIPES